MVSRDQYDLIKVLRKLELFHTLTEEEAPRILELSKRRAYEQGEVVWQAGDPGVDMQVLVTGLLHVKSADGQTVGQVKPGASFGEMACLTGHERFVGFEAVEPCTALSLSRDSLRGLIAKHPTTYVKILEATIELLARRVTRTSESARTSQDGQPSLW